MRLSQLDDINAKEQGEFAEYLLRIGRGEEKIIKELGENVIELPNNICMQNYNTKDLINNIFDNIETKYNEPKYFTNRGILCANNKTVESMNNEILKLIPEDEINYFSTNTSAIDELNSLYPVEFLNEYHSSSLPLHELSLKKNTVIMLLRNININQGLCNGTKLIIKNFKQHVIEAEIITGKNIGMRVFFTKNHFYNRRN